MEERYDQQHETLARVYDRSDGEHVANLTNERLVHEFAESPLWDVELLEEESEEKELVTDGGKVADGTVQLETFAAPECEAQSVYTFETDELTALCPFDFGGPDFYELTIRYTPADDALESKSLKEYLEGFRSRELTAEQLGAEIYAALEETMQPESLYVRLEQARRGGIEETVEVGNRELGQ